MSQLGIVVRTAKTDDVVDLAALEVRSWRAVYGDIFPASELRKMSVVRKVAGWQRTVDQPDHQSAALVAESEQGVVGFLQCGPARGRDAERVGEVYSVYVEPEHWGCGVGTALMDIGLDFMAPRFRKAVLWVVRENDNGRAFYESRGFHEDRGSLKTYSFFNYSVLCVRYSRALHTRRTFNWGAYFSA